ncbi:MAG: SAM-dependent methyltransferase, partial [Merismopediaceae bacterium]|nr:SAM-dependent methyltransferase [Merismopediaceae bacterium]
PQRVFQEVERVLAPQGYFYLADFSPLTEQVRVPFSPGGIRFYTPNQRELFAEQAGLRTIAHRYLIASVVGSIFQKP